jgi:uncharacterized protein (TIGR03382 family)
MLQQVSEKLLGQFVDALEVKLAGGSAPVAEATAAETTRAGSATANGAAPRVATAPEPEAVDLLELAGGTALTKYAAAGAAGFVLLILAWLVRRRRTA